MKRYTLFFICICTLAPIIFSQISAKDINDFEKMTFDANLTKSDFVRLEPISVRFRFSNKTDRPLITLPPDFTNGISIRVIQEGNEVNLGNISLIRAKIHRFPQTFESGDFLETDSVMSSDFDKFFPAAGKYTIQFILDDGKDGKVLRSSSADITINEPVGIDKEAFDFITKYQKMSSYPQILFSWNEKNDENGDNLIERFVKNYGSSTYGQFASYSLANYYLHYTGELLKAGAEFEKLKLSKNSILSRDSINALSDIAKRKMITTPH